MKVIVSKKAVLIMRAAAVVCLALLVTANVLGAVFDCRYLSVFAAAGDASRYEIKSQLLMEAMQHVGVCTPKDAAAVWADGLKQRSAAMQYSVMSEKLKDEYARKLERNVPNWVTGVSSPWIKRYEITDIKTAGNGSRIISLVFYTETSAGPAGEYKAALIINREGSFWRIESIDADRGLNAYMGFDP